MQLTSLRSAQTHSMRLKIDECWQYTCQKNIASKQHHKHVATETKIELSEKVLKFPMNFLLWYRKSSPNVAVSRQCWIVNDVVLVYNGGDGNRERPCYWLVSCSFIDVQKLMFTHYALQEVFQRQQTTADDQRSIDGNDRFGVQLDVPSVSCRGGWGAISSFALFTHFCKIFVNNVPETCS